jgi:thiamine transport system ATP-binding protein
VLSLRGVSVRYGERLAVSGVDLDVGPGEIVAILGPSGGGKSTLLRAVAGLEPLAAGRVEWRGEDLAAVAPHRRGFGLMFQDHALFPHRDVEGNVEFGLRMQGAGADERRRRVREALDLVGLTGLERRDIATLSGGERQRVAFARTLAPRPRLVMLDEPLGSLDRDLHDRLLGELATILDRTGAPALYVTHDHDEAFELATRVALVRAGRIVQTGSAEELWDAPADEWVATFLGFGPAVDACAVGGAVETPWGRLVTTAPPGAGDLRVVVRPGAWRVEAGDGIPSTVRASTFRGDRREVVVTVDGRDAPPVRLATDARVAVGDRVALRADPAGVVCFPRR